MAARQTTPLQRLTEFFRDRCLLPEDHPKSSFAVTQDGDRIRISVTMMASADDVETAQIPLRTHLRDLRRLLKELSWNYYTGSRWSMELHGDPDTPQATFETVWLTTFTGTIGPRSEDSLATVSSGQDRIRGPLHLE